MDLVAPLTLRTVFIYMSTTVASVADASPPASGLFQNVRQFFSKLVGGLFAEEAKQPLPVQWGIFAVPSLCPNYV